MLIVSSTAPTQAPTQDQRPHSATAIRPPAGPPRTFTFTNLWNGDPITVQCMVGCESSHETHTATPSQPEDVDCTAAGEDVELPFVQGTSNGARLMLRPEIHVTPFSSILAERLPTVSVEVVDDGWFSNQDPDGLDQIADFLQGRVDALRAASVQLAAVRAEYKARTR